MDTLHLPHGMVATLVDVRIELFDMDGPEDPTGLLLIQPLTAEAREKVVAKLDSDIYHEAGFDEFVVASKHLKVVKETLESDDLVLQIY